MKPVRLSIALAGMAVLAGLGYWWYSSHAAARQDAPAPANNVTAQVVTQPVHRQALPLTMDSFGEIATGKPDSLSFPQAGQVAALPVVLGQHVRRGELLASLASDPNAVSAYAQAASSAGFARRELARQQELLGLQLATQSQVDAARKQLDDAQAALAAQAKLGGERASAELRAPYDGIVSALSVAQGDRIAAGAVVIQLGRADRLRALLALEPAQSALVRSGMPVTIAPVLDGTKPFEANIASTGDLVDPKSQMVTAIVELPDGVRARLVAGARVQATIRLGQRDAWVVPRQAVLSDEQGTYLFQVRAGKAHRVAVTRIAEVGQLLGVDGPVDGALPVVALGNYELNEGMSVREGKQ
jgi:membrane fusion protein (multidrug efflux system)